MTQIKLIPIFLALRNARAELKLDLDPMVTQHYPAEVSDHLHMAHSHVLSAMDEVVKAEQVLNQWMATQQNESTE